MLQPLRGKILVEVLPCINRTESGLYLTPKEEVPHRGRVVEIGLPYRDKKGRELAWGICKNHIIHYKRNWDGGKEKYQILRRDMIYAVEHESKAYSFGENIIVKKTTLEGEGIIFVPSNFESEVSKQEEYGIVISVGREDKLGINIGDKIMMYKNEGFSVKIPLQDELWSLRPKHILARV